MAYDNRLTLSNEQKVDKLAAANSYTSTRLSDQFVFNLGTNRVSELRGLIGDTGKPFEQLIVDYVEGL